MNGESFATALRALDTLAMPEDACEQRLVIAGMKVRARLSTRHLAESALRALAHHAVTDASAVAAAPDLTVLVLDRDAPGNPLRDLFPAATSAPPMGDRVERWCYEGAAGRGLLHEGFRTLFLWDREHGRAAVWLGEGEALPYHLVALPLLPILSWAFAARGLSVVHAAAVATASGALLIGGRSGTGKSTTALACLDGGLGFLGDDMCVIEPSGSAAAPIVHSLYCSAKLDVADTARFPALSAALAHGSGPGWQKSVYLFDRHRERDVVRAAPLAGVAIPRRDAGAAVPLSPRQGFLAMAPNTAFQLPGAAQASIAGVKEIVSRVPVHSVGVGATIAAIPARVSDFARTLTPPGARAGHVA